MKRGIAILAALLAWSSAALAQPSPPLRRSPANIPGGNNGPWQYEIDQSTHSVLVFNSMTGDLYKCSLSGSGPFKCMKAVRDPG